MWTELGGLLVCVLGTGRGVARHKVAEIMRCFSELVVCRWDRATACMIRWNIFSLLRW